VSDAHGGGGGSSTDFVMDAGDFITQIEVRSGDWIDQLQFLTSASEFGRDEVGENKTWGFEITWELL
jgi:hypothetical protein